MRTADLLIQDALALNEEHGWNLGDALLVAAFRAIREALSAAEDAAGEGGDG